MSRHHNSRTVELAAKLKTPKAVQLFLREMVYNEDSKSPQLHSAERALREGKAHCFEAAFIAAAILEFHGHTPAILSFESQDGLDHVLFVFQKSGLWGAIGRSRDEGLHGRAPRFRSLLELTRSYEIPYIDKTGRITGFQISHLDESGVDWRAAHRSVWGSERYLIRLPHIPYSSSDRSYLKHRNNYLKQGPIKSGRHWW